MGWFHRLPLGPVDEFDLDQTMDGAGAQWGDDSICKIGPSLMPYVSRQIQTINRHQRTHYTAQGQMVFDEISLNAIVKLSRMRTCQHHKPPTVQK